MNLHLKGLCSLILLGSTAVLAQDMGAGPGGDVDSRAAEIESFEPAVSSQELAVQDMSREAGAASPALAPDVTRSEAENRVMDRIDLERTEITGNQELPKVLYIVPWQKSDPGDLMGKPVNTLLDEVLAPIDRSEFMRQVDYYGDLKRNDKD